MKQIQGKINFAVILLRKKEGFGLIALDDEFYSSLTNEQMDNSFILSDITEEQAAEFVNVEYKSDAINVAKRNLEILLKENNVWIKEWKREPFRKWENEYGSYEVSDKDTRQYEQLPDDLLLIKL